MAVFEYGPGGQLVLKSVTKCCSDCAGKKTVAKPEQPVSQPEPTPDPVSEHPAEPTDEAAQPVTTEEVNDDASHD